MVLLLVFLAIKRENKPEDEDENQDEDYNATTSANVG
jgi:hypothetical protein